MAAGNKYGRKREDILAKAAEMFATRGFDGTTLEAVADALGYTKPALYYYFKNKEELFCSLVLDSLKEAYARIEEIAGRDEAPSAKLGGLIRLSLDEHMRHRGYFSFNHMLYGFKEKLPPGPVLDEIESISGRIPQTIMGIIAEGIEAGEFRREDPRALGAIIFGMLSGIMIHIDLPPLSEIDGERLKTTLDEIIVKGISP